MKRWFSLLLAAALMVAMAATPACAAEDAYAATPVDGTGARINNVELAAEAIDGYTVAYGETFSFNDAVGARTKARGYQSAVNGRGVKVVGGGVAQVASTLYLALQNVDGISYDELRTYGNKYNQDYVDDGSDAILVDDGSNVDFRFTNYTDDMSISAYISGDYLYVALYFGGYSGGTSLLGHSTIYVSGTSSLYNNVGLAADSIDGFVLAGGDTFSFNDTVGARTKGRGYESAVNGRGAKVVGGGVAQVASALWLAVKDADDISVTKKSTYGSKYNQDYVSSASDAILTDYDAGTDFAFRYDGPGSIRIDVSLNGDTLECEVYATDGDFGGYDWSDPGDWSVVPLPTATTGWWW